MSNQVEKDSFSSGKKNRSDHGKRFGKTARGSLFSGELLRFGEHIGIQTLLFWSFCALENNDTIPGEWQLSK